jgi:hypothetical protein
MMVGQHNLFCKKVNLAASNNTVSDLYRDKCTVVLLLSTDAILYHLQAAKSTVAYAFQPHFPSAKAFVMLLPPEEE